MSYSDYEHCPGCDGKTIYMGDRGECPEGVVTWHETCLAKRMTEVPPGEGMYKRAYFDVQSVLDDALGTEDEDGAGEGIAADVRLLADRLKAADAELRRVKVIFAAGGLLP